jgi:hypothetical protein
VIGLAYGLAAGLVHWVGAPPRTSWANTPRTTYRATRALTVLQISLIGLAVELTFALAGELMGGLVTGLWLGLPIGLAAGLASVSSGAWLSHALATGRLATSKKLPFRLMDFLDDAYRLGLLRTTGPAYQFRHAEFHDHLIQSR